MSAPFRPTRDLTNPRAAVLSYVKMAWGVQGVGPSARDVAGAIGADKETARNLLRRLEADGLIVWRRARKGQRSEILPADPQDRISVPDAIEALRRSRSLDGVNAIGELLRSIYPQSHNPLPMAAVLSHLDAIEPVPGFGGGQASDGDGGNGG